MNKLVSLRIQILNNQHRKKNYFYINNRYKYHKENKGWGTDFVNA